MGDIFAVLSLAQIKLWNLATDTTGVPIDSMLSKLPNETDPGFAQDPRANTIL
jgi:hypothetical protein